VPTIISHAAVPLLVAYGLADGRLTGAVLAAGVAAAMAPDLDVAAFRLGIPYEHELGHRGASHALFTAALMALAGAVALRAFGAPLLATFAFLFGSAASHGLLDSLTNGGNGVALLWPFADDRWFAPVRPIQVSPIGISRFLSSDALPVLASELVWIWVPGTVLALFARWLVRSKGGLPAGG
jgi:inner membrane protein